MKITPFYHLTAPCPVFPETDAVFQEVNALHSRFGGAIINLYPLRRPSLVFPRFLYGIHQIRQLQKIENSVDLHHVYHPVLYAFPVLRCLKKPVIYSVVSGLRDQKQPRLQSLDTIHSIVVSNKRDQTTLRSWGIEKGKLILPGINLSKFSFSACLPHTEFTLTVGSAPWVGRQFKQKGIDALLETCAEMPNLRLIFLWRGLMIDELQRRIKKIGVRDQVEVINQRVDVNKVFARSHAAVVLAEHSRLVKAYPHSLLESLSAGKPVLVSRCIPMADYVAEKQCGEVVSDLNIMSLRTAIENLMTCYDDYQQATLSAGRDFSRESMLAAFERLYRDLIAESSNR